MSWDQADLTDDYCARRKIARQTFAGFQTGPAEGTVADAMKRAASTDDRQEDAGDGDGWMVARIPHVRGAVSQAQPDEEAREKAIGALRELFAARAADRTDSDSLELTVAA